MALHGRKRFWQRDWFPILALGAVLLYIGVIVHDSFGGTGVVVLALVCWNGWLSYRLGVVREGLEKSVGELSLTNSRLRQQVEHLFELRKSDWIKRESITEADLEAMDAAARAESKHRFDTRKAAGLDPSVVDAADLEAMSSAAQDALKRRRERHEA